jgi:hypothetical protein
VQDLFGISDGTRTTHRAKAMGFVFQWFESDRPFQHVPHCSVSSSSDTLDGVSGRCYYACVGGSPPRANRKIQIRPS